MAIEAKSFPAQNCPFLFLIRRASLTLIRTAAPLFASRILCFLPGSTEQSAFCASFLINLLRKIRNNFDAAAGSLHYELRCCTERIFATVLRCKYILGLIVVVPKSDTQGVTVPAKIILGY